MRIAAIAAILALPGVAFAQTQGGQETQTPTTTCPSGAQTQNCQSTQQPTDSTTGEDTFYGRYTDGGADNAGAPFRHGCRHPDDVDGLGGHCRRPR
ncbi:MAG: hypothetical protein RLO50_22500 [Azospirillaceae bacterium]